MCHCRCTALGLDEAHNRAKGWPAIPALPTAWNAFANWMACCMSMTARRPTRRQPRPRWRPTRRFTGFLGGQAKTDDLDACAPYFGHVKAAYTIGDAADLFEAAAEAPTCRVTNAGTLDAAVPPRGPPPKRERRCCSPRPAHPSISSRDFEARGDAFRAALVEALAWPAF
jgi:UDP-N-acetylmuramoylalanine--D-glutamate ligase